MSNCIIVDGIKFYECRAGYFCGSLNQKPIRLHRYIWQKHYGEIPKGFDIHHKDHDKSNNSIENLELVDRHKHHSDHMKEPERVEQSKENLNKFAHIKAIEWHKSDVGRLWHKEHYKISLNDKWDKTVSKVCEVCGNEYSVSPLVAYKSRFCSNKCKAYYRRHSGVDDIDVICCICNKVFKTNKYSPALTCSQQCENKLRKR